MRLTARCRLRPTIFLKAAQQAKNLQEFVELTKRLKNCPLRLLANNIDTADEIVLGGDMIEFINQDVAHGNDIMTDIGVAFHSVAAGFCKRQAGA